MIRRNQRLEHNYYYNPSGTWYHNFSPNLINEFRATYSRRQALSISAGANTNLASQIGIQGTNAAFFPTVTLLGLAGFGNTNQQQRLQTPINSNQYVDNASWQRGNHQFKFGGELRTSNNIDNYFPTAGGSFAFTNTGIGTNAALGIKWVGTEARWFPVSSSLVEEPPRHFSVEASLKNRLNNAAIDA